MGQKVYLIAAGAFFLVMNVLLWNAEFGQKNFSVPLPLETIVKRLFEAPDDSKLEIRRQGVKIGYCRWAPSPIVPASQPGSPDREPLEGMISSLTGYEIDLEGTVAVAEESRLRFIASIQVNTNYQWQQFHMRLQLRPWRLELHTDATNEVVRIKITGANESREHQFKLESLAQPLPLLQTLAGPEWAQPLALLAGPLGQLTPASTALGLQWLATSDRQRVGRTPVDVYKLTARLLDQRQFTLVILDSGEVLKAELPNQIVLVNDEL